VSAERTPQPSGAARVISYLHTLREQLGLTDDGRAQRDHFAGAVREAIHSESR